LIILASALLAPVLDDSPLTKYKQTVLLIASGALLALSFFTRQSSGAIFFPLFVAVIFVFCVKNTNIALTVRSLIAFLTGFAVIAFVFVAWLSRHGALTSYFQQVFFSTSSKGRTIDILFRFIARISPLVDPSTLLLLFIAACLLVWFLYSNAAIGPSIGGQFKDNSFLLTLVSTTFVAAYLCAHLIHKKIFAVNRLTQYILLLTFVTTAVNFVIFCARWTRDHRDSRNTFYLFSSLISFAWMYAHGMSGVLEVHALLPGLPFLILLVLGWIEPGRRRTIVRTVVLIGGAIVVLGVSSARFATPYYWWGWREPDVRTATFETRIPKLEGFYLSESTKREYEMVYDLVLKNTTEHEEVFTFPHILLFNVMTSRINTNFSPVTYFDVCTDPYARETANYVARIKPRVIVVMNFPEDAWSVHEQLFRGGRLSGQREIVAIIKRMKDQGLYETVYVCSIPGNYPIEVLVRVGD